MSIAMFASMYNKHSPKSNIRIPFNKIKATEKWVTHSINLHVMQKLLLTASRDDRYTLLAAIKAAESKVNYHYKHPNFNLAQAVTLFKQAKRMLRNQ
jgi:hypothetical protein